MTHLFTEEEQANIRSSVSQGFCGSTIARDLHLSLRKVLLFLKEERLYFDGRESSRKGGRDLHPEEIRACVQYHQASSLGELACRANYTSREGVKQWLGRHDLLDRWRAHREAKKSLGKEIAFVQDHLSEMTEHLGRLFYRKEARETHDCYLTEVLEKRAVEDGHTGYLRLDALPAAAKLLRAYDFFQAEYGRPPKYPEIVQLVPKLSYNSILLYLGRTGRALTPMRRTKSQV